MGLSATITVHGPDQLNDDETGASVLVDYSLALLEAVDAFMHTAKSLCPVDTGYLLNSINAEIVGTDSIHVEATAPYAQYVEYGTSYMEAQPFFEPGIEAAVAVLGPGAQDAVDEAAEDLEELVSSMLEGLYQGAVKAGFGAASNVVSGLMGIGMMILMFPLMLYAYGIMDALQPGGPSGFDRPGPDNVISQIGEISIMVD